MRNYLSRDSQCMATWSTIFVGLRNCHSILCLIHTCSYEGKRPWSSPESYLNFLNRWPFGSPPFFFCTDTLLYFFLIAWLPAAPFQIVKKDCETIIHQSPVHSKNPERPLFQTARGIQNNKFLIIHSRAIWSCKTYYYSHNSKDY